ncbi:MAG: ABC transporter substrate-binding protein [Christensenellales bacterium]|jgi:peptide/nickel transport system substrate-binding protein
MRKLSIFVALLMLIGICSTAAAEGAYSQAPLFDALVEAGELPPVEERLPETPRIVQEILPEFLDYEIGNYGGTLRLITKAVNWDADVFVGSNEALLTMASSNSDVITANIVENYEISDDNTVFTFTLRKGLKWSDGTEVTMDDFRFGIEDFVLNTELTPVVAAYMRDGGTAAGDPFTFEVIDDDTFSLSFKKSYGGLIVHLSISGWKGYTDLLKPAHFLKPFHLAYAAEIHGSEDAYYEYIRPFAAQMGYDDPKAEGVWAYVFHQIDMTNWELTDPNDALTSTYFEGLIDKNFPVLYPWTMKDSDGGLTVWERNPYYFKVDPDGQQLPYVDTITSTLVEDMEMVQLKYMTGEADFGRESATIDNISLYRENETSAGITAYVTTMHVNPTVFYINLNYGLNTDGSLKDDPITQAWQEVINDIRFRQALMHAVDAEEIVESVYKGFGEVNPTYQCDHDIEYANALLDEMGVVDIDGDGYRETPSGKKLQWQIWNNQEANDFIPFCELLVEFWGEIGLKAEVNTTEPSLMSASQEANEVPMRVTWAHSSQLWHNIDWGTGGQALWQDWFDKGGLSGMLEGSTDYLVPPQEYQEFFLKMQSLMTVTPEEAVNEVIPELGAWMGANLYMVEPTTNVLQCVIMNSDLGNVPSGGVGISWNFSMEQFYYKSAE